MKLKYGEVLIGGWLEGKYTGTRYVHANGEILAKVCYSDSEKIYFNQKVKNRTGACEKKCSLNINNFAINFYKRLSKFENYDTILIENKLKISSNFYLPISIAVKENYEVKEEEIVYGVDEAKEKGIKILKERLNYIRSEDILNEDIITNENDEYIEVKLVYEVIESIGTEEKIAL